MYGKLYWYIAETELSFANSATFGGGFTDERHIFGTAGSF